MTETQQPKRKGRPPGAPRTAIARWLQARNLTAADLHRMMEQAAIASKLTTPSIQTIRMVVSGRLNASARTMLLIRDATGGLIDLRHWVLDDAA